MCLTPPGFKVFCLSLAPRETQWRDILATHRFLSSSEGPGVCVVWDPVWLNIRRKSAIFIPAASELSFAVKNSPRSDPPAGTTASASSAAPPCSWNLQPSRANAASTPPTVFLQVRDVWLVDFSSKQVPLVICLVLRRLPPDRAEPSSNQDMVGFVFHDYASHYFTMISIQNWEPFALQDDLKSLRARLFRPSARSTAAR